MNKKSKIYVAGHNGLAGSAIVRRLKQEGYMIRVFRTRRELDLTRQEQVEAFFREVQPEYVFLAADKVGGIMANNSYPASFLYENLVVQTNIIHASYLSGVRKLIFLGSSCIYPKECPQPMKEEYLLSGYLEPTNEPYAIAKISGIKMCQAYNRQYGTNYISVMPTNLYGPKDNFDLMNSHILPAMIRKFHLAKLAQQKDLEGIKKDENIFGPIPEDIKSSLGLYSPSTPSPLPPVVPLWETGRPGGDFLHVDDLADACLFLMKNFDSSDIVNIGTGKGFTIKELADIIQEVIGFEGDVKYDSSKPDSAQQKLLDVSKLSELGWQAKTELKEGIKKVYEWYIEQCKD